MTAEEFGLWAAFYRSEPFGDVRGDIQAGVVASTVANYAGKVRDKSAGVALPTEFIPRWQAGDEPDKPAEVDPLAFFNAIGKG